MKVLSPLDTAHELIVILRTGGVADVVMELKNEASGEVLTHEIESITINGLTYLSFEQEFDNDSNFQITITSDSETVYRGKLFVTDQSDDTQGYKITKDTFTL